MRAFIQREELTESLIYAVYGDHDEEYTHCFVHGASSVTQRYYMIEYAEGLNIPTWVLPTVGSIRRAKNKLVREGRAFFVDKYPMGPKGFILKGHVPRDVDYRLYVAAAHRLHNAGLPVSHEVILQEKRKALSFSY